VDESGSFAEYLRKTHVLRKTCRGAESVLESVSLVRVSHTLSLERLDTQSLL